MAHHVNFEAAETYFHKNFYPSYIKGDKGIKTNFRRACKPFSMLHGQLTYNDASLVIFSTEPQHTIISDVHIGLEHDPKAKTIISHCGRDSTMQKTSNRFLKHSVKGYVEKFIKKCDQCQKQRKIKKISSELHSILIKTEVMQQIGIDICSLPEVDGFKHLVVCIDYFSKCPEADTVNVKVPPPFLSSFMRLYVGIDV